MLNKEIKVTWKERTYKAPIEKWIPYIGTKIYEAYIQECAIIRKQGTIVDFTKNLFGKTFAIIDSGDNKIIKLPINKLTVLHSKKKHG